MDPIIFAYRDNQTQSLSRPPIQNLHSVTSEGFSISHKKHIEINFSYFTLYETMFFQAVLYPEKFHFLNILCHYFEYKCMITMTLNLRGHITLSAQHYPWGINWSITSLKVTKKKVTYKIIKGNRTIWDMYMLKSNQENSDQKLIGPCRKNEKPSSGSPKEEDA